jgi:hypothetical protein
MSITAQTPSRSSIMSVGIVTTGYRCAAQVVVVVSSKPGASDHRPLSLAADRPGSGAHHPSKEKEHVHRP